MALGMPYFLLQWMETEARMAVMVAGVVVAEKDVEVEEGAGVVVASGEVLTGEVSGVVLTGAASGVVLTGEGELFFCCVEHRLICLSECVCVGKKLFSVWTSISICACAGKAALSVDVYFYLACVSKASPSVDISFYIPACVSACGETARSAVMTFLQ